MWEKEPSPSFLTLELKHEFITVSNQQRDLLTLSLAGKGVLGKKKSSFLLYEVELSQTTSSLRK